MSGEAGHKNNNNNNKKKKNIIWGCSKKFDDIVFHITFNPLLFDVMQNDLPSWNIPNSINFKSCFEVKSI